MKPLNVACPNFTTEIRAKIRYKKTRGVPQFSVSGQIRFRVQAGVRVTLQGNQVVKAELVPTNIQVVALNLKHVPNWLDNSTKIPNWLSNQLTAEPIDITPLVQAYVNQGGPGAFA